MSDKHPVFDANARANESMTGYLAVGSDNRIALYLNERAHLSASTDRATVKIHQIGLMNQGAWRQHDVVPNHKVSYRGRLRHTVNSSGAQSRTICFIRTDPNWRENFHRS